MTEWEVVGVLVVLAGLLVTVGSPLIKLNTSITKLTESNRHLDDNIVRLVDDLAEQKKSAHESHRRLWEHNVEQDNTLSDHETRITILEKNKEE